MTPRARVLALAFSFAACLGPRGAAAEGMLVALDAGIALPASPPEFGDFWKLGWSVGGTVSVVVSPVWEIATAAHHQRFAADEEAQIADLLLQGPGGTLPVAAIDGRDAQVTSLTAEARLHARGMNVKLSPYLIFGAGFFTLSTGDATVTPDAPGFDPISIPGDSDSAFAATLGAGLRRRAGARTFVTLESIYVIGFTEGTSTQVLPLTLGLAAEF